MTIEYKQIPIEFNPFTNQARAVLPRSGKAAFGSLEDIKRFIDAELLSSKAA